MSDPINGLERLLAAAAADPSQRSVFTKAVLASQVCASPMGAADGAGRVTRVRTVTTPSGEAAAAVFTAPARLAQSFGSDAPVLETTGRALLDGLRSAPVMLNPGWLHSVVWSPLELAQLLDGMATETLQQPLDVMLAHPAQRPEALIARLSAAFATMPAVRGAWLMLAHRSDEPDSTWMMGVDSSGPWTEVQASIKRALDDFTFDRRLDVLDLSDKPADTLRTGIALKTAKLGLFGLFR